MENRKRNRTNIIAGGGAVGMSKELPFLVYCIEEYKVQHKMGGKDVVDLFNRYKVNEYIITCYDALHTTGARYIVEDIDEYINARKKTA